jgi:hypothetical protein
VLGSGDAGATVGTWCNESKHEAPLLFVSLRGQFLPAL